MTEAALPTGSDSGAIFDAHVRAEFVERDIKATMATMSESPYVTHVPVLTGGYGREQVQQVLQPLLHRPLAGRHGDRSGITDQRSGTRDRRAHHEVYP
jgi:hypothetical protein